MPEVLLVRHGRTELNDPSNEKIRGYSDVPISFIGKQGVEAAAEFIAKQKFPVKRILASPLQRGMMTASLIAEKTGSRVIPNQGLLPWSLGALTGQPIKEVAPKMDYLQEFPDIKSPEGESYKSFYTRWADALDLMLYYATKHPDETLIGVVHSRNLLALPSILGSRQIGDVPVKGGPGPESVTRVHMDDKGDWKFEVIWDKGE